MTASASTVAGAHRRQRVIGAIVGSVVGDAVGAPFEFGPSGQFSARFPSPVRGIKTEMCGGGGWRPAEWTDDTQQALICGLSLLDNGGVAEADMYARFQSWLHAGPNDVGIQTRAVLSSSAGWEDAARLHFAAGNRAAGNGSLMRATTGAVFFSKAGDDATADAARSISDLTHGDPAAGDGCVIFHLLVAAALRGDDPIAALPEALDQIPEDRRAKWEANLAAEWTPGDATESNGAVWPTLASAVWALRSGWAFEDAMRHVIDLGGDTDTVAAVTGGLIGAVQGIQAIPSRWSTPLNGDLPGQDQTVRDLADLQNIAMRLDGEHLSGDTPTLAAGIPPAEVLPGLWLSDLPGAASHAPDDAVVISLCRTFGHITAPDRRQVFLTDDDSNIDVTTVVTDVLDTIEAVHVEHRPVLVHCWGGASRTGLILRAWLMRRHGLDTAAATEQAKGMWPHLGTWNQTFDRALDELDRG